MKVIGLTGGIGSGKTAVSDEFHKLGVPVIDADVVSRSLTARGGLAIEAIRCVFGARAVTNEGAMDRVYIRDLVFQNPEERKKLENVLHPLIQRECLRQILEVKTHYCILSVPLLIENGFWKDNVERVLLVDVPEEVQIARVKARSGLSEEEIRRIMATQATRLQRLNFADDVIMNTGPQDLLTSAVQRLHERYLKL